MAPPELTADAPVLDVAHPAEVHVLVLLGHELDLAAFDGGDGLLGQRFGGNVPLVGQPRLDDGAGAITAGDFQRVVVDLFQQAHGVELGDDGLARIEAVHVRVAVRQVGIDLVVRRPVDVEHLGLGEHRGVAVEDIDQRQVMTLADLVVVEVMRRGDLHAAGTELEVDVVVGDDRDQAVDQRQHDVTADQALVALVLRVHGDGGVTEHGFRTGSGDHQVIQAVCSLAAVGQRITQVPEMTFLVMVLDFEV